MLQAIGQFFKSFFLEAESNKSVLKIILSGIMMVFFGLIFIEVYSRQFANKSSVFAIGSLVAFAALGSGGILGFIFGIPRVLVNSEPQQINNGIKRSSLYQPNTNLEQISDWLTKILVGASLTQIPALLRKLKSAVNFLEPGLRGTLKSGGSFDSAISKSITLAILIYFLFCGFVWFYLWVRIDLPSKFFNAYAFTDLEKKIQEVKVSVDETYEKDSLAETLVFQQLNTADSNETTSYEELEQALRNASETKRNVLFEYARRVRYSTWRNRKEEMERTIPVFEILTKINPNNYRYYAELAYALNSKNNPDGTDYQKALQAINKAIELRSNLSNNNINPYHEFIRALCNINLINIETKEQTEELKETIKRDLAKAIEARILDREKLAEEINQPIHDWLRNNSISFEQLENLPMQENNN